MTTTATAVDPAKVKPLRGKILVKQSPVKRTSASGRLHLPDVSVEKPQRGTVVNLGLPAQTKDGRDIPYQVAVGDEVLFARWSGNSVQDAGIVEGGDEGALIMMSESDILLVLNQE